MKTQRTSLNILRPLVMLLLPVALAVAACGRSTTNVTAPTSAADPAEQVTSPLDPESPDAPPRVDVPPLVDVPLDPSAHSAATPGINAFGSAWPALTQSQRGDRIYAAATADIGRDNGNCKIWTKDKILQASGGLVTIPATKADDVTWSLPNRYVSAVRDLRAAIHGDVLQMRVWNSKKKSWGPHTAIVISINGDQLTVVDANWLSRTDPKTKAQIGIVGTHSWSIGGFLMNRQAVSGWTLYRIGGGS